MKDIGALRPEADVTTLTTGIMAALQGGYLLAQTARDIAPVKIALDMALAHVRTYAAAPQDRDPQAGAAPADPTDRGAPRGPPSGHGAPCDSTRPGATTPKPAAPLRHDHRDTSATARRERPPRRAEMPAYRVVEDGGAERVHGSLRGAGGVPAPPPLHRPSRPARPSARTAPARSAESDRSAHRSLPASAASTIAADRRRPCRRSGSSTQR